jgi:hypothetical protein
MLMKNGIIDPAVLATAIFIEKGILYSRRDYDYTLLRLADLGVFKFISVRFEEKPDHRLDCMIFLTPAKKHSASVELEASNIEDNVGVRLNSSTRTRTYPALPTSLISV